MKLNMEFLPKYMQLFHKNVRNKNSTLNNFKDKTLISDSIQETLKQKLLILFPVMEIPILTKGMPFHLTSKWDQIY